MRQIRLIFAALLLISPFAANGDLINYDYAGFDGGDGWTSFGTITIDEADVIAGGDLVSSFLSWDFAWTDGVDVFSLDSSNSSIDQSTGVNAVFSADTSSVLSAQLCFVGTGQICNTHFFPIFGIFGTNDWVATTDSGYVTNGNTDAPGEWAVRSVSEPGTLALLGIGLAGMGLARRKRKV